MVQRADVRMKILGTVVALEVNKGHLRWTIAEIARRTKVSRALVYYHFGKTKGEILDRCLETVIGEYFALGNERAKWIFEGRVAESLAITRKMFLDNPSLVLFYMRWRTQPSPWQKKFREVDKRYQAKLKAAFPHLSDSQVLIVHGLYHGLVTAPFMTAEALKEGADWVSKFIEEAKR